MKDEEIDLRFKSFLQKLVKEVKYIEGSENHEEAVMNIVKEFGYKYDYQPNGTQSAPDFDIYLENGSLIELECKSSKGYSPMYNSGRPHKDMIYFFSSKKAGESTLFFGRDIFTDKQRDEFDYAEDKIKELLFDLTKDWENSRGFTLGFRRVYAQKGCSEKTNYFTHKERNKCEQNVLNYEFSKGTGSVLHESDNSK